MDKFPYFFSIRATQMPLALPYIKDYGFSGGTMNTKMINLEILHVENEEQNILLQSVKMISSKPDTQMNNLNQTVYIEMMSSFTKSTVENASNM